MGKATPLPAYKLNNVCNAANLRRTEKSSVVPIVRCTRINSNYCVYHNPICLSIASTKVPKNRHWVEIIYEYSMYSLPGFLHPGLEAPAKKPIQRQVGPYAREKAQRKLLSIKTIWSNSKLFRVEKMPIFYYNDSCENWCSHIFIEVS